jgi:transcriptional regulator with XRE-family HTH domain
MPADAGVVIDITTPPSKAPNLLRLRVASCLSQRRLAQLIGVELTTLGSWERGEQRIPMRHREQLAELFGVSVDYLLGRV